MRFKLMQYLWDGLSFGKYQSAKLYYYTQSYSVCDLHFPGGLLCFWDLLKPFLWQMDDSKTPIFLDTVNSIKQTRTGIYFACIFPDAPHLASSLELRGNDWGDDDRDNCDSGYVWSGCSLLCALVILLLLSSESIGWSDRMSLCPPSSACTGRQSDPSCRVFFPFESTRMPDAEAPKDPWLFC